MTQEEELFNRLDRIREDHEKTLRMLYEDGGKEAVINWFSALCAALDEPTIGNDDWKLAVVLSQVCSITSKRLVTVALMIKLAKPRP